MPAGLLDTDLTFERALQRALNAVSPPATDFISGATVSIVDRAADTLFDEFARSDTAPKSHTESMFRFLNRRGPLRRWGG